MDHFLSHNLAILLYSCYRQDNEEETLFCFVVELYFNHSHELDFMVTIDFLRQCMSK